MQDNCYCNECNRNFKTVDCFNKHKLNMHRDKMICELIYICRTCHKLVDTTYRHNVHTCGETWCKVCRINCAPEHVCYVKRHTRASPKEFNIIFFDLECTQETPTEYADHFKHVANLCITKAVCENCFRNVDHAPVCAKCTPKNHCFDNAEGRNCVDKFLDFLEETFTNEHVIVIAHNLKGYDGHFIMEALANRESPAQPIMVGWKVIRLQYRKYICFIDSVNFLKMSLSSFPSAFGLTNVAKGYFPHFFNREENADYIGPMPPKEMYGYNNFTVKDREAFITWYDEQVTQNAVFNFRAELRKYCEIDVDILKRGCVKFMIGFIEALNINPFLESSTLASAVMLGFRKNYLRDNCLAIVPKNNYNRSVNSSAISRLWLAYTLNNSKIIIEHKTDRGNFSVDGFNPETGVIYEFLGCFFHGCKKCFKHDISREKPVYGDFLTLEHRYENTLRKLNGMLALNYVVVTI